MLLAGVLVVAVSLVVILYLRDHYGETDTATDTEVATTYDAGYSEGYANGLDPGPHEYALTWPSKEYRRGYVAGYDDGLDKRYGALQR